MLSRHEFRDALHLRYDLPIDDLPVSCSCKNQAQFTKPHALSCNQGGWVESMHNSVRDVLTDSLNLFAHAFREPCLHPVSEADAFKYKTTMTDPNARSDIVVIEGLFGEFRQTYIDVQGACRLSPTSMAKSVNAVLQDAGRSKIRQYGQRIKQVEHGDFIPFTFTSSGHLGAPSHDLLRVMASNIAHKFGVNFHQSLTLLRLRVNFAILKGALRCLRAPRSRPKPFGQFWAMSPAAIRALTRVSMRED